MVYTLDYDYWYTVSVPIRGLFNLTQRTKRYAYGFVKKEWCFRPHQGII